MALTNTEWYLRLDSWTHGWSYDTFQGDPPPDGVVWFSPVWLTDDFGLEWSFSEDLSPSDLDPIELSLTLSCATAADIPEIDTGDVVELLIGVPGGVLVRNGDGSVTGIGSFPRQWSATFQVTDLEAEQEDGDRITVAVTATTAIRDVTVNLDPFLADIDGGPYTEWQAYSDDQNDTPEPEGQFALDRIINGILNEPAGGEIGGEEWAGLGLPYAYLNLELTGYRGAGLRLQVGNTVDLSELVKDAHALWYGPKGSPGHPLGYAAVAKLSTQFDGSYMVETLLWDPTARADQAAPFHLTYVSSVLDSEPLAGATADSGDTLSFIDGCMVRAKPQWRKNPQSVVDVVEYKGFRRSDGADSVLQVKAPGVANAGLSVRQFDTNCYIVNAAAPAAGFTTYGGLPAANLCNFGVLRDRHAWATEEFDILPKRMTDAQWLQLFRALMVPGYSSQNAQHSLLVFDVDEAANLSGGTKIWATVMGCAYSIEDGHLVITPKTRPFVPAAIYGITDDVTWAELDATHPAATFAQAADDLTWAQVAVSSLP